jgi:predicted transcriptional regulator
LLTVRPFGELESAIMSALWLRRGPATVRGVLDDLNATKNLAYTTVMTVLDNLHRKGAVTREKSGRAWLYRPAYSREQYTAQVLHEVLGAAGDRRAALQQFVADLTPEEVSELGDAVKAARRRST